MGYTIIIGNAVLEKKLEDLDEDSNRLPSWTVEDASSPDAPVFPNDPSQNTNARWPSYSAWSDFARSTGLWDLFYDPDYGLMRDSSDGVFRLFEVNYTEIDVAVDRWLDYHPKSIPGFTEGSLLGPAADLAVVDATTARLLWLQYWVRWALDNCKLPAIGYG